MASRGVHLHDRDLAVLELLLDRRVETLDHIHGALFSNRIRIAFGCMKNLDSQFIRSLCINIIEASPCSSD